MGRHTSRRGFTLSELLIALAVLSLLVLFTIPKVLEVLEQQTNEAVLKETVAALHQAFERVRLAGGITGDTDLGAALSPIIQAQRYCPTHSEDDGCWDSATQGTLSNQYVQPVGFVLHNGATIAGIGSGAGDATIDEANPTALDSAFVVDANGVAGPNQEGVDQMYIAYCFGPDPCATSATTSR
jgi:prepilin-type N-terminal cleavage/methylation domain-containing protein